MTQTLGIERDVEHLNSDVERNLNISELCHLKKFNDK